MASTSTQPMENAASAHAQLISSSGANSLPLVLAAHGGRGLPVELLMLIVELVAAQGGENDVQKEEEEKEEQSAVGDEVSELGEQGVPEQMGGSANVVAGHDQGAAAEANRSAGAEHDDDEEQPRWSWSDEELEADYRATVRPSGLSWVPCRPGRQLDLASLRLASKLLCQLATPHFYKVMQISDTSCILDLVTQLQAQPKLCLAARGIWWNIKLPTWQSPPPVPTSQPYLVRFPNVDDVAWCEHHQPYPEHPGYPIGIHYALRDAGAWCELPIVRHPEVVVETQCTPTLRLKYEPAQRDMSASTQARVHLLREWRRDNPGGKLPYAMPWELEAQQKRAIWAAHVVLPALSYHRCMLYELPRSVTHLTITLYTHAQVDHPTDLEQYFEDLLRPRTMPFLEYLVIRVSNIGEGPDGLRNIPNFVQQDNVDPFYADRAPYIEMRLDELNERRSYTEPLNDGWTTQETLYEDVRKYTLHQWQERVYHNRNGPWKDPMTTFPSQARRDGLAQAQDT